MTNEELLAEAAERGKQAGESAASWVVVASRRTAEGLLNDVDPEIMDLYSPPNWLSGEWAGESIPELLGDLLELAPLGEETIMSAYEDAANNAYWRAVEQAAESAQAVSDNA